MEGAALPREPVHWKDVTLRALCTEADLAEEGRRMHHCAATLARSVAEGAIAVFHADVGGEALTFTAMLAASGWKLLEIAGVSNAVASEYARTQVGACLAANVVLAAARGLEGDARPGLGGP
jgi:hypothetical protein